MEACLRRGIPIVGVNERHPSVDVFSFLGPLCVKQLHDCGLSAYKNRIAVLCDNDFVGPLRAGLASSGASVDTFDNVQAVYRDEWDAIIVALRPAAEPRIGSPEAIHLAACAPPVPLSCSFGATWTGPYCQQMDWAFGQQRLRDWGTWAFSCRRLALNRS